MITKRYIFLVLSFLAFCNIAKCSDPNRIKQIEQQRATNDKQINQYVHVLYTQLTDAKAQLEDNSKLIPSLQSQINILQADDTKINTEYSAMSKKYSKLKTAFVTIGSLLVGLLMLLALLKFNVLLPYGWIAIPVCMAATTTF